MKMVKTLKTEKFHSAHFLHTHCITSCQRNNATLRQLSAGCTMSQESSQSFHDDEDNADIGKNNEEDEMVTNGGEAPTYLMRARQEEQGVSANTPFPLIIWILLAFFLLMLLLLFLLF